MSFITGILLVDAPASALNNLGSIDGARTDNTVGVKVITTKQGEVFPYVSAQAFRYWLRETLQRNVEWKPAPIYREEKVAYTDANPLKWWDDDLLGYMRAPSTKQSAVDKRSNDQSRIDETSTTTTITRVSPFRNSTLVSIAPVKITQDFGTMSRHEGDPVPHEHQFYRATLRGLFSLDLNASGTFSYRNKTGYRNLDDTRIQQAQEQKLEHLEKAKSYRLPTSERLKRISALLDGMARLEGGAKQSIHYTDVAPPLVILAVTKGGNHIFGHVIGVSKGLPTVNTDALAEALSVFSDEIVSNIYVGWVKGYLDEERAKFETWAADKPQIKISHPRDAYQAIISDMNQNPDWLS
ncbi:MAG TPA: type I-B CRISPR-associated protein Cas7/Cst2/DevR [Anaerolineales bacterium]|nr:type I-B CRISPR-associated protein Cas7/Cst2/DevR [Anaerolineales bacterium]